MKEEKKIQDDDKRAAGIFFILVQENQSNKTLILKRTDNPFKGLFCLPGGKAHIDEPINNAAIRETVEETGHFSGKKIGKISHETATKGLQWTTFFYTIDKLFIPKLSHEHNGYKWIDLTELGNQPLLPAFKKYIGAYEAFLKKHKYM